MKRKILFYHEAFPAGGTERVTLDIANYISNFGYETYVLTHQKKGEYVNIQIYDFPREMFLWEVTGSKYVVELINMLKIDIFVFPVLLIPSLVEEIKKSSSCKVVFSLHSIPFWEVLHMLYEKRKKSRGSLLRLLKWQLITYPKTIWFKKYDKRFINQYLQMYQCVDAYTVLCEGYRRILIKKLKLRSSEKICVFPNTEVCADNINMNKKKEVIFVGRLTYEDKRVDRLLKIWKLIYKKVPDWNLIIIGDGEERGNLRKIAFEMNLKNIYFVGHQENMEVFYKTASILCLTSTFEGWPLCLTESQANGVVPVAFDCCAGIHEILAPSSVNGVLVTPYRLKEYANKLLNLMLTPEILKEMSRKVRVKCKQYAPESIGEKWLKLFDSLLTAKK